MIAASEFGDLLVRVIGSQTDGQMSASLGDGVQLPRLTGSLKPGPGGGGAKKKAKSKSAEERGVDSWVLLGFGGFWKRVHRIPLMAMFTPRRVAGGPGRGITLKGTRVTKGTYVASGRKFQITDFFDDPNDAHRMMSHGWIGTLEMHQDINVGKQEIKQGGDKKKEELVWVDVGSSDDEPI